MQITLDLSIMSRDCLVAVGNALSVELDRAVAHRAAYPLGYHHMARQQFMAVSNELTARGLERSDYLRCPDSL